MLDRYVRRMEDIFGDREPPKMFVRARAIQRVLNGESIEDVTADTRLPKYHLRRWVEAVGAGDFYEWLGKREPTEDRIQRARQGIAQMMLAAVAEEHFEALATESLGGQGFSVEDDRVGRTDTDYRVIDGAGRPVLRINIKFHGTLFRQAEEYVRLAPDDCFALATYKIHGALLRQDQEGARRNLCASRRRSYEAAALRPGASSIAGFQQPVSRSRDKHALVAVARDDRLSSWLRGESGNSRYVLIGERFRVG